MILAQVTVSKMTSSIKGNASWSAPSNIALVKYWGKRPVQLPGNASLSLTLEKSRTRVDATWFESATPGLNFTFENKEMPSFGAKVEKWLSSLALTYPRLKELQITLNSSNTFPHSAGIASSASSMAAMAFVVSEIVSLSSDDETAWLQEVSSIARLGSGSAARSLFPHAATWGQESQQWGSGVKHMHDVYRTYGDAILVVDSAQKAVSSSQGHALMDSHPFKELRYQNANKRVTDLLTLMQQDDFEAFAQLVELEALELHALMMTSNPSFILMKPKTLELIERVRAARAQGHEVCFTLDAGPNLHLLYPQRGRDFVLDFVAKAKADGLLDNGQWIDDHVGAGPRKEA